MENEKGPWKALEPESDCASLEGSREEVAVGRVFACRLGFGGGVVGMGKCFSLRNSAGKESMAGKASASQDLGAVRLVQVCNAGSRRSGRVVKSVAFLAKWGRRGCWTGRDCKGGGIK